MSRKQLVVNEGDKYGRMIIISEINPYVSPSGKSIRKFLCSCECGNTKEVDLGSLRDGSTQSCGCLRKENQNKLYRKMTIR